jgi:sulfoquinovosidase
VRSFALLPVVGLFALGHGCNRSPNVGGFRLSPTQVGFSLVGPDGGTLLQTYEGGSDAYAPLAVRDAHPYYQMAFGSFDITDGVQPWSVAASFRLNQQGDGKAVGVWSDSSGGQLATLTVTSPVDGVLVLTVDAANPNMNRISMPFECESSDHFLGFGEQSDALDHAGQKVPIWTSEHGIGKSSSDDPPIDWPLEGARHSSNMGLPTWLSQRGFIGAIESPRRSIFELCSVQTDAFRIEAWSNELKLWIFYGPDPATALQRAVVNLFGLPVRPPPLAFAPWNDAIFGSDHVRAIAGLIRDAGFPSSVIWTEDFRGGADVQGQGYRLFENWDIDTQLYPDAGQVAADLHNAGFAWLAYYNSFVVQNADIWNEALDGGYLLQAPDGGPYLFAGETFEQTGLADLSNPQTVEWVKSHMRKALDIGFDGWMADFGEWEPWDAVLSSGEDPLEAHDLYPVAWQQLNADVLAERAGDGRQRVFFARSGWYGTPPITPVFWPADQRTDFETDDGMPTVVPLAIGAGLAGVSTFGSDIAGYQSISNPTSTKELFFRWTELGALSPVMRTHHGLFAEQNWWFDEDADTLAHFTRWTQFHMQLYPYLDASSAIAESTGIPITRALVLAFPQDPPSWTIYDQYLLGPSLLVAPVMTEGAVSRTVHLPPGHWYPIGGGTASDGPADITAPAPVTEIPVFAPAGAIIPALPVGVQTVLPAAPGVVTLEQMWNQREIWLFAGAPGTFVERDGTTYSLTQGGSQAGYAENGTPLPNCTSPAQRGCVDMSSSPVRVRLSGSGPLTFGGSTLTIQGPSRTIDVLVTQ